VGTFKFPATFVVFLTDGGIGEPGGFELVLLELFVMFEVLPPLVLLEAEWSVEFESTVFKFFIVFLKKKEIVNLVFYFFKFRSRIKNL